MKIFDIISSCFQNLFRRKIRTMLTLLGVMLGSASVALTFALGEAVKQNNQQLLEQNANLQDIQVSTKDTGAYGSDVSSNNEDKKYLDDRFIKSVKEIPGVKAVKYELIVPADVKFIAGRGDRYLGITEIKAVDFEELDAFGLRLKDSMSFPKNMDNMLHKDSIDIILGEYFDYQFCDAKQKDRDKRFRGLHAPSSIYVMKKYNQPVPSKLLPPFVNSSKEDIFVGIMYNYDQQNLPDSQSDNESNQGKDINNSINSGEKNVPRYKKYKVNRIGTLDWDLMKDDPNDMFAFEYAFEAYVNIETGKKLIKEKKRLNRNIKNLNAKKKTINEPEFVYENIVVKAESIDHVADISKEIAKMGYEARNAINTIESEQLRTRSIQFVFGVLGGITLLVSALSVATTMITSVYERTHEIGIMKVIGCKIGNIQIMFLIESAIIGLLGGAVGMGLSFMLVNFMNKLVDPQTNIENLGILAKTIADFTEGMKSSTFAYSNSNVAMKMAIIKPGLWILVIIGTTLIGLIAGYIPSIRASRVSALKAIKDE